jgi:hypothetical protein
LAAGLLLALGGCGEPTARELRNRQEVEALLTAVSLKNQSELEKDAQRIETRHDAGELSEERYRDLRGIIDQARAGKWAEAEQGAYALREQHPYFR